MCDYRDEVPKNAQSASDFLPQHRMDDGRLDPRIGAPVIGDASAYGAGKLAPPDQASAPIVRNWTPGKMAPGAIGHAPATARITTDTMRAIQRNQIIAAKLARAEDEARELRRLQGLLDEYNIDHLTDLVTLLQKHGL